MRVANRKITERGDIVEISADVDGFRLWYRIPKSYKISRSGDAFLASVLLPAMRQGEKIEIDQSLPVSPKLLKNVFLLQEIYHTWNPKELEIVPISASSSSAEPLNIGAISFFSSGVDSLYTFLKHKDEISHTVFMHGFDFYANSKTSSTLTIDDLRDLGQFAFNLMKPRNAIYAFLKDRLSKTTLEALSNYQVTGKEPGKLESELINDLNTLINGSSIYEAQRFQGIGLRSQTQQLLMQNPQGKELQNLNRLLLEDACPQEISGKINGAFQNAIERNTQFVQRFGKTLIPIEHNHYAFGYRYNLSRNLTHGSVLGSVALLLGFPYTYIPSSWSYQNLTQLGSHALTDPLWSNESMEIIHDGAEARRTEKLVKIAKQEYGLTNLRVCFNDINTNCGKCSKCLRTMIPLKLMGFSSVPFPPLPPTRVIRKWHIHDDVELSYLKESIELFQQSADKELYNAVCACIRKSERRKLYFEIDRFFLCGFLKKIYRRFVKVPIYFRRIDTIPPRVS
jgi:hypothetical protein